MRLFRSLVIGIACLISQIAYAQQPEQSPFWFGEFDTEIKNLKDPSSVLITDDDEIVIIETGSASIRWFDRNGIILKEWGVKGTDRDQLLAPYDMAIDNNEIFVTDSGNHKVVVYTTSGDLIRSWGIFGRENGQFDEPAGIVIRDGHVYVCDLGNDRIQIFNRKGEFLNSFGSRGKAQGQFRRPLDITADAEGLLYVADGDNSRIQVFNSAGEYLSEWGNYGPFVGFFDEPRSVFVYGNEVVVTDRRNHRIQFFSKQGKFIAAWGVHEIVLHEGAGKIHYPASLAIAPSGEFAVVCETVEDRCQIFTAAEAGSPRETLLPTTNKTNQTHFGDYISIDDKLIVMAEPENNYNIIFDIEREVPVTINKFGDRGEQIGLFMQTTGLTLDLKAREIIHADPVLGSLHFYKMDYDPEGELKFLLHMTNFTKSYDWKKLAKNGAGKHTVSTSAITALERGPNGNYYVIDRRNHQIVVLNEKMEIMTSFGKYGYENGQFNLPTDISFSSDGKLIYVVDSLNARIQLFDLNGKHQSTWSNETNGSIKFIEPFGIESGKDKFVYVTDRQRHKVLKFTETGETVTEWGAKGADMAEFWKPKGIAQAEDGRIFVIDQGNHRSQIFSPDGEWLVTYGTGRAYTRERPPVKRLDE